VINKIGKRKNYISRKAPKIKGASYRGERLEQVIAVNIDRVVIVTSIHKPDFNNRTLDRFLASAESSGIDAIILLNKIDLDENEIHISWKELYENIGYKVVISSVISNRGLEDFKKMISGKRTLFWGQSGVGKSSILNSMFPHLDLKTGVISRQTLKGTHTTVTASLIKAADNTYIIDTPGIREIDPYGIRKTDLGHYFIEFKEFLEKCKFNTCTHYHEPGCAVVEAVENNLITLERYDSYLRMLETIEEDIIF